jgi:CBS domain-containing protein
MHSASAGQRLTIYVGESDSWRGRSLYMSILETLRQNGIAGATVVRGQAGFGAHSLIHTWRIERLSVDLPMIITVVDTPENIARALTLVKPMVREGLITLEDVHIVKYTHRYLHPLPADLPVSAVMTQQVSAVAPDAPALDVIELLLGKLFKAVPVVDAQRRVVGIVTETDLLEKAGMPARLAVAGRLGADDLRALLSQIRHEKTAGDIMTAPAITARADEALGHVVQRMLERGLRRLPVTDAEGRLVGMISRVDVLRAAAGAGVAEAEEVAAPRAGHTLGEVMISQVPAVRVNDDLVDVLQQMLQGRLTYVVVLDETDRPVGVITEGDLVERVAPPVRRGVVQAIAGRVLGRELPRGDVCARDIMSEHALTAPPEMSIPDAIALMIREGRKRIVVTGADGRPLGLVDRQALLAASFGE